MLPLTLLTKYSFIRDARLVEVNGEKTWVVMARSHTFESVPENSNYVRVDGYVQTCVMRSDGKKGSIGQSVAHSCTRFWLQFLVSL